jgi:FMN phosphatase YigB (HAD superfamily)
MQAIGRIPTHGRQHYDAIVISGQAGMREPDLKIFVLALARLDLPGE